MFVLCISALSLCCGNRRLPFTWNVSSFSWSLTFLLKCMAGEQWNKLSIFLFYSCSYLHGLECEYCGNKCLHPFNTSQQEGRVEIFQFRFISVINLNFNQLNEPFKSIIIIYNSFIQFMSSSLHLLKDPMHLSLFSHVNSSFYTYNASLIHKFYQGLVLCLCHCDKFVNYSVNINFSFSEHRQQCIESHEKDMAHSFAVQR